MAYYCKYKHFLCELFPSSIIPLNESSLTLDHTKDLMLGIHASYLFVLFLGSVLTKDIRENTDFYNCLLNCVPLIRRCISAETYIHPQNINLIFPPDDKVRLLELCDLFTCCKKALLFGHLIGIPNLEIEIDIQDIINAKQEGANIPDGVIHICAMIVRLICIISFKSIQSNPRIKISMHSHAINKDIIYEVKPRLPIQGTLSIPEMSRRLMSTHKSLTHLKNSDKIKTLMKYDKPLIYFMTTDELKSLITELSGSGVPLHIGGNKVCLY